MIAMIAKVAEMATTTRCNSHASKFLMPGISLRSKETLRPHQPAGDQSQDEETQRPDSWPMPAS